jgi:DNA-binding beta-propeller fold protein YncE
MLRRVAKLAGLSCGVLWWLAVLRFAIASEAQSTTVAEPLALEAKISLGEVSGRIDHLAFDATRKRLYVAELGNDSIGIVDLEARRLIRTVSGFDEPQGVGYEPATDTVYVANGGDGTVRLFSSSQFTAIGTIELGKDADNVRVDRRASRVYVGYGDGALAVIDVASRKRIADIALEGHPEGFQLDPVGDSIFVNVPDAAQIAVLSREAGKQVAAWPTGALRANYPLALDVAGARVISVFRDPAHLQAYELRSGRVSSGADACRDSDDVFADPRRHRIYVVCGEGYVDVLDASGDAYARIGRFTTSSGSRTGLFVPELDRLLVAIRASRGEAAAVWILRPPP